MKLENENYMKVSFIVVNHHGEDSRAVHSDLQKRVSKHVPVYEQEVNQADVWSLLQGVKNDFFIYDRCGLLVRHIGLPFSFLQFSYVEDAIKQAYCGSTCAECKQKVPDDVCKKEDTPVEAKTDEEPVEKHPRNHGRHHQQKEAAAEDSNRPHVRDHRKHHHHHQHKAKDCQTPHDRVAEHNEPEGRVEGVPERAAAPNTEGSTVEDKL